VSVTLASVRIAKAARCVLDIRREAKELPERRVERRWAQARTMQRMCAGLVETLGLIVRTSGPMPFGRVLLVSNHLSYLDPLILASMIPCVPLAKREVEGWPVLGARTRELGTIFVDRDDTFGRARALRAARRALRDGLSVLNFPEGSTTRGEVVLPFRRGLFGVALELGVQIVPCRIDYPDPALTWVDDETFLPHFLGLTRRPFARAHVRFGAPLEIRRGDDAGKVADRARALISKMHLS
jgi:1-acyl-sn-glycerol-3-phosphate acyltransferase